MLCQNKDVFPLGNHLGVALKPLGSFVFQARGYLCASVGTDSSFLTGESYVLFPVFQGKDTHGKARHSLLEKTEEERRKRLKEEQS